MKNVMIVFVLLGLVQLAGCVGVSTESYISRPMTLPTLGSKADVIKMMGRPAYVEILSKDEEILHYKLAWIFDVYLLRFDLGIPTIPIPIPIPKGYEYQEFLIRNGENIGKKGISTSRTGCYYGWILYQGGESKFGCSIQ